MPPAYATTGPRRIRPTSPAAMAAELAAARAIGETVLVAGHGTRPGPAAVPARVDRLITTDALDRVTAYEPDDLTITVQCGIDVLDLDRLLADHGQMLPVQRRAGTLGGLLATAADGLCDAAYGRVRRRVLGATVALANGALAGGRGRVVKNVAGYDVPRLMVGSLGTLGALVEVSLKLHPRPAAHASLLFSLERLGQAFEVAGRLADAPAPPACLDVLVDTLDGDSVRVSAGFDGTPQGVARRAADAEALLRPYEPRGLDLLEGEADDAWRDALDVPEGAAVLRAGCAPTALPELAARLIGLAARDDVRLRLDVRPALGLAFAALDEAAPATVRAMCAAARELGHGVLVVPPPQFTTAEDVWGPPPPDLPLMRRVKGALDPGGVFASGRYVGGL